MSNHTAPTARHASTTRTSATYRAQRTASAGTVLVGWLFVLATLGGGALAAQQYAQTTCQTLPAATSAAQHDACDALVALADQLPG